ncbi:hypothetical protein [Longimicrobium sp.]|uniref:hypothetical protein n=1 Tax=Longimicrobium sp. TaxID=2029185 RepID=UPI003B3A5B80
MKKIRLDLDALSVETFSTTGGEAEARGTVKAHRPDYTQGWDCQSIDICETGDCATYAESECGTCATLCATCYEYSCGVTICNTCVTCGERTCQPGSYCSCNFCQYY